MPGRKRGRKTVAIDAVDIAALMREFTFPLRLCARDYIIEDSCGKAVPGTRYAPAGFVMCAWRAVGDTVLPWLKIVNARAAAMKDVPPEEKG
jgi:hypothetical protein